MYVNEWLKRKQEKAERIEKEMKGDTRHRRAVVA
jgi:hypothetical protein